MKKAFDIIARYAGANGAKYILHKQKENPFDFKISKPRNSKHGDFRFQNKKGKLPVITVNGDLNQYFFLLTFVHEYAHLTCVKKHGAGVQAHGAKWKNEYAFHLRESIGRSLFPSDVEVEIEKSLGNLKSSTQGNAALYRCLRSYDKTADNQEFLEDLQPGMQFMFRNRLFVMEQKRRTRYLCKEMGSGKQYLISGISPIQKIEE